MGGEESHRSTDNREILTVGETQDVAPQLLVIPPALTGSFKHKVCPGCILCNTKQTNKTPEINMGKRFVMAQGDWQFGGQGWV